MIACRKRTEPALFRRNQAARRNQKQARFEAGKALYPLICGACHQPSGLGQEGLAPPLLDSEWVRGSERRLIRIILHGLRGPLTVKGKLYELDMPPLAVLEDEQIASILTYVRREWGHSASAVEPVTVTGILDRRGAIENPMIERSPG